jgi:hypothetical protein
LIRIGPNVNGSKTHLWHPLDLTRNLPFNYPHKVVFDINYISIVDLGHVFLLSDSMLEASDSFQNHPYPYFYPVVAATYPGEQQPLIVTLDDWCMPLMIRPGDDRRMQIPNVLERAFEDVCNFKGRLCMTDHKSQTVMVGSDLSIDFVTELLDPDILRLCSVESELLLVNRVYVEAGVRIDVYRLDEKQKKWVKLSNLGDRVLFLGERCSFSVSSSDLGFAYGNCVIFMDDPLVDINRHCGISVLNFDEARLLPLSDYPDYFNLLATSGVDRGKLHWEK